MAKSLVCKQCNALFRNIAEAQTHNEVTGHVQFEESTEAVKLLVCTTCGKPCRTDAERDLHKRANPGHDTFAEKTADDQVLDTEKQMKEARDAMMEDDELLSEAMKKKKAEKAEKGGEGASGSGEGQEGKPEEMVEATVDEKLLQELEAMGFSRNRAVRAIHFSHASEADVAVNWLVEHENDMDIDEPLMVPKGSEPSVKLSPEEARKKAEELARKARERREREEKEMAIQREKERIRVGRELQAAKQKEQELAMQRLIEQRKREKEEEARYKEALRLKLEEDRKERRRKLGLPEELSEEEKAAEAAKAAKAAEEAAKKAYVPVKPISVLEKVRKALVEMKKSNDAEPFKTGCATMLKYIGNIAANPGEDKFRSIKLSNAAFQQRVAVVAGSFEFLQLLGFQRTDEALVMAKEAVNVELLNSAGAELNNAMTNPFFGAL